MGWSDSIQSSQELAISLHPAAVRGQPVPAFLGRAATSVAPRPSISQIAGVPSLPCHKMSDLPSPLKSPLPSICQLGPGLNDPAAPIDTTCVPSIRQEAQAAQHIIRVRAVDFIEALRLGILRPVAELVIDADAPQQDGPSHHAVEALSDMPESDRLVGPGVGTADESGNS
jgi:hypothetical protein